MDSTWTASGDTELMITVTSAADSVVMDTPVTLSYSASHTVGSGEYNGVSNTLPVMVINQ